MVPPLTPPSSTAVSREESGKQNFPHTTLNGSDSDPFFSEWESLNWEMSLHTTSNCYVGSIR